MAVEKLSIQEDQARQWIANVKQELAAVENVKSRLIAECNDSPENDDIFTAISNACDTANDFWTRMCNGFDKACVTVDDVIGNLGKTVEGLVSNVDAFKAKIGQ